MKAQSLPFAGHAASLTPGLRIEWRHETLASRARMRTGVPAFVGFVGVGDPKGAPARPVRARTLDRWEQFGIAFADARPSELLALAVRGFFENGGERCVVVPVLAPPGLSLDAPQDGSDPIRAMQLASCLAEPFADGGELEDREDIDLVCVPDAMTPAIEAQPEWVFDLQTKVVEHCSRMGERFAILDALPAAASAAPGAKPDDAGTGGLRPALLGAIGQWQSLPADHGALYFPWVRVRATDAAYSTAPDVLVPPCGHVAGVYARSDRRVGVHKAPANEELEGVVDLGINLSSAEQARLNEAGVNCLREWRGWGIRVWGARTLSDRIELRYVNVTRVMLTLKRWLEHNLRDLVFEPNTPALWRAIEDRVSNYLRDLHQNGALKGNDASEAFFVRCDEETNSAQARDAGTVQAVIGLATVVPAEFVIVRITQSAAGVTVDGPVAQA